MSKKNKLKKALQFGIGATLGAKFLSGKANALGINVDKGRGSDLEKFRRASDPIVKGGKGVKSGKIGTIDKIKNFMNKKVYIPIPKGPGPNATSKMGGTLAGDYGDAFSDAFGMPKGAKAGKMIKAVTGVHVEVESRGNKLARPKKTKIY